MNFLLCDTFERDRGKEGGWEGGRERRGWGNVQRDTGRLTWRQKERDTASETEAERTGLVC